MIQDGICRVFVVVGIVSSLCGLREILIARPLRRGLWAAEITPTMTHEELIREALNYRRNVGSSVGDIRRFIQLRDEGRHTQSQDRAVLRRLEDEGQLVAVGKKWFFTAAGEKLAKGSAMEAQWEAADSWILLAALYNRASSKIDLPIIIGTADYINHAILTLEEIHGAINRLLSARLIKTRQDGIYVTEKSQELMAKIESTCGRYVLNQLEGLGRLLKCPCCGVRLRKVRWRFLLDEATYQTAVESYLDQMR